MEILSHQSDVCEAARHGPTKHEFVTDWGRNLFREKDWHNMFAELREFLARYELGKEKFLYSPNDIVDADDTLGLLFVEHYGGLCNDPHEAAVTCQEAVAVSLSLTFADHWNDWKGM